MNAFHPMSIRRSMAECEMPNPMMGRWLALAASLILSSAETNTVSSPSRLPCANPMDSRKSPVPIKRPSTVKFKYQCTHSSSYQCRRINGRLAPSLGHTTRNLTDLLDVFQPFYVLNLANDGCVVIPHIIRCLTFGRGLLFVVD